VPSKFYTLCLGSHLKYSSAVYPDLASGKPTSLTLDQAEDAMLTLYVERAQLQDGWLPGFESHSVLLPAI